MQALNDGRDGVLTRTVTEKWVEKRLRGAVAFRRVKERPANIKLQLVSTILRGRKSAELPTTQPTAATPSSSRPASWKLGYTERHCADASSAPNAATYTPTSLAPSALCGNAQPHSSCAPDGSFVQLPRGILALPHILRSQCTPRHQITRPPPPIKAAPKN
jgi:hypothetical protein